MKRKRLPLEDDNNTDRWVISYADFITLLFAFFVVMYAISTVNSGKLKVMAAHFDATFSKASPSFLPALNGIDALSLNKLAPSSDVEQTGSLTQSSNEFFEQEYTQISSEFKTSLLGLIEDEKIKFKETDNWVEIALPSEVLFRTGSSRLLPGADEILEPIALLLNRYNNPIQVEGFTDKVPIQNELFPSNWELSAQRASSVVRRLINFNVDAVRLAAIGYGSNFPVATNATEAGRKANRRVVLLIAKQPRRDRLVQLQKRGNLIPAMPQIPASALPAVVPSTRPEPVTVDLPPNSQVAPTRTQEGGLRFSTVPGR